MNNIPKVIPLVEHETFNDNDLNEIKGLGINFQETQYEQPPKFLGIHPLTLQASYYIGAEWLTKDHAIVVTPKMPDIDFIEMFVCALKFDASADYFAKFYGIDLDSSPIRTNVFNNRITPLIVIHFIALLKKITARGLKKEYIIRNENLQSGIKGKISISRHIRKNIIPQREDRIYCQYQEYTVDNPENRILKKALLYAESYINTLSTHHSFPTLISTINNIRTYFTDVSEDVNLSEIRHTATNKVYKEYAEGIRIAKMILRRFNYSISETKAETDTTPAFWIDMSRLYEVYVYSKLHEQYGDTIIFQVPGHFKTAVDFVDTRNKIIIDTKYKPRYDGSNSGIIDDIRQLSAYARDSKILEAMGHDGNTPADCLIIYPEKMGLSGEDNEPRSIKAPLLENATPIKGFRNFYKISFEMPRLS